MIQGWKDISAHVSRVAGYDVSAEAIRKMAERDRELAGIIGESVTGKPLVAEYELERWVRLKALPRTPRLRRMMRAVIEAGQMVLL